MPKRRNWRKTSCRAGTGWRGAAQDGAEAAGARAAHVISSVMEGGANVICEALAADVPVLASHMSGNIACWARLPRLFPVGDERRLAKLLSMAETDPDFYAICSATPASVVADAPGTGSQPVAAGGGGIRARLG